MSVSVSREDLLALLDYVQPDEERDIEGPDNDNPGHVVYVCRRLRASAELHAVDCDMDEDCTCGNTPESQAPIGWPRPVRPGTDR